jgi:hypothetical protein
VTADDLRPSTGLLDTSVVIRLSSSVEIATLPEQPLISAVTLAELSVGPLVTDDPTERAARQAHLQQAEADFEPIPFDAACARAFGRVAASLRQSGRRVSARSYDAMIAATAMVHDLPLFTANPVDFDGVDGLTIRSINR